MRTEVSTFRYTWNRRTRPIICFLIHTVRWSAQSSSSNLCTVGLRELTLNGGERKRRQRAEKPAEIQTRRIWSKKKKHQDQTESFKWQKCLKNFFFKYVVPVCKPNNAFRAKLVHPNDKTFRIIITWMTGNIHQQTVGLKGLNLSRTEPSRKKHCLACDIHTNCLELG